MSVKSVYHSINACEVLTTMFLLPKKEQANYLKQFMVDLSRDDAETAITAEAREVILHTDERRGKASRAGKASSVSKISKQPTIIDPKDGMLD